MRLIGCLAVLQISVLLVSGQIVFEPSKNSVYDFLDEMAAGQKITLNSFSKPYSRKLVASLLSELERHASELNSRQLFQLQFFLKDYGKELQVGKDWDKRRDLFYYSDSLFSITVNPILGGSAMLNERGGRIHRRVGASFFGSVQRLGFYASLRDNAVSEVLALPQHLSSLDGQNYKSISSDNRSDYNETLGGISYDLGWAHLALVKERFVWGNTSNNSIIFSGKAPSYAAINLRIHPVKWLDFQYIHGWLISEDLDSSRTYLTVNGMRRVYKNKNIAANYFTIKSNWRVNFTFGNSIIYSDGGFQPVYLIPFLFYKSADHTYSGTGSNELGQNSQLFFDISARVLKQLHIYTSLFIDEISLKNITLPDQHTNIVAFKLGTAWYNALPNLHLTAEYSRCNPWTYRHQIPSSTFESNNYNLGFYLGENSDELYLNLSYQPWHLAKITMSYWRAQKGPTHTYEIINGNANVAGLNFLESKDWYQQGIRLGLSWEILNDLELFADYTLLKTQGNRKYTPDYFLDSTNTMNGGFRIAW